MSGKDKVTENMKLDTGRIKMRMSDPALKKKITTNITDPGGTVYWYIRFNIALDPASVTKHTMNVTERNGYILNVIFTYDSRSNLIVLNPMDLYRQNEYYILNISKKVRPARGRPLSKSVHIMFKILGEQISDFQVLKNSAVPKPRKKPVSVRRAEIKELMAAQAYEAAQAQALEELAAPTPEEETVLLPIENETSAPPTQEAAAQPVQPPDKHIKKVVGKPILSYGRLAVKVQLAILGLIWLVLSFFFANFYVTLVGIILVILGLAHICAQLAKARTRAAVYYDLGVWRFNSAKYAKANSLFQKSQKLNPNNEMTQYALTKVAAQLAAANK